MVTLEELVKKEDEEREKLQPKEKKENEIRWFFRIGGCVITAMLFVSYFKPVDMIGKALIMGLGGGLWSIFIEILGLLLNFLKKKVKLV